MDLNEGVELTGPAKPWENAPTVMQVTGGKAFTLATERRKSRAAATGKDAGSLTAALPGRQACEGHGSKTAGVRGKVTFVKRFANEKGSILLGGGFSGALCKARRRRQAAREAPVERRPWKRSDATLERY